MRTPGTYDIQYISTPPLIYIYASSYTIYTGVCVHLGHNNGLGITPQRSGGFLVATVPNSGREDIPAFVGACTCLCRATH